MNPLFRVAAALLLSLSAAGAANYTSNGTGGGNWSTSSTWLTNIVPGVNDTWTVAMGDTVTAGSGVNDPSSQYDNVLGTLDVGAGASLTFARLNYNTVVTGGAINVSGGSLALSQGLLDAAGSTTGSFAVTVSNGGTFAFGLNGVAACYTVTVNNGGTVTSNGGSINSGAVLNLNTGGTFVVASGLPTLGTFNWNGGTFVTNSETGMGNSALPIYLTNPLQNNAANVLQISNQATRQTLTLGSSTTSGTFNPTQGDIAFRIYSATANDNDLIFEANPAAASNKITLTSSVHLLLSGLSLSGSASDYLGASYQFFSTQGSYATINPTVDLTTLTIGGQNYTVTWTNDLSSDGTLVIAGLTATPEPSALALAALGLGALALRLRTRRAV